MKFLHNFLFFDVYLYTIISRWTENHFHIIFTLSGLYTLIFAEIHPSVTIILSFNTSIHWKTGKISGLIPSNGEGGSLCIFWVCVCVGGGGIGVMLGFLKPWLILEHDQAPTLSCISYTNCELEILIFILSSD